MLFPSRCSSNVFLRDGIFLSDPNAGSNPTPIYIKVEIIQVSPRQPAVTKTGLPGPVSDNFRRASRHLITITRLRINESLFLSLFQNLRSSAPHRLLHYDSTRLFPEERRD